MKTIKTVNGPVKPEELGFCDIHDHLWKSGGMEVREDKDFAIESIALLAIMITTCLCSM
jgi:predicted metal-dependent phosphotriesterase family hydrolase